MSLQVAGDRKASAIHADRPLEPEERRAMAWGNPRFLRSLRDGYIARDNQLDLYVAVAVQKFRHLSDIRRDFIERFSLSMHAVIFESVRC